MAERSELQKIASDLEAVKKLLVLSLIQKGFKQKHVASVLGVGEATLSEMFSKGLLKQAREISDDE
jgi:predicted transcriptional regulator